MGCWKKLPRSELDKNKRVKYVFRPCTITRNYYSSLVEILDHITTYGKKTIGMSHCSQTLLTFFLHDKRTSSIDYIIIL